MNPDELMSSLFAKDDDATVSLEGEALPTVMPRQNSGETMNVGSANNRLQEMRDEVQDQVYARLSKKDNSRSPGSAMMAGLTANSGKVSQNKLAAFLNGMFTSGAASYKARQGNDEDLKTKMDLVN